MATKLSYHVYREACEQSLGWCPTCKVFSRECTEPDIDPSDEEYARDYTCEECETPVYGAEQALIAGAIVVRGA